MKKLFLFCAALVLSATASFADVSVTATAGTLGPTPYTTLGDAFTAINAGTHQGAITISVVSNTTEAAATAATLNSTGAGAAVYSSVLIRPTADGLSISGNPAGGFGVIQLNGADSVTIDGDNPNTAGTNRNLVIQNTAANTVTFTAVIRVALNVTDVTTADNNTFRNLILLGSGTGQNIASATGTAGSANNSYGILATANASGATTAPTAISSTATAIGSPATASNLTVQNNTFNTMGRAIAMQGSATTVFPGLLILNNLIGNNIPGEVNQVYSMGVTAQGSTNAIIRGNTAYVESFMTTGLRALDAGGVNAAGSGTTFEKNQVLRVRNNNTTTFGAYGINLAGGNNHVIQNNFVLNVRNDQVAGTGAFSTTFGAMGIRVGAGTGHRVYHNSVHLFGAMPGTVSTNLTMAFGIVGTGQTGVDVRNNIFSNLMTGGNPVSPNTRHVAVFLPSGATVAMNLTWNNNDYVEGTDPNSRMAQTGLTGGTGEFTAANFDPSVTTPATNFRAYTSTLSAAGTNDNASQKVSPLFISDINLHLAAGSPMNNGGAAVSVLDDIDGDVRSLTTPDIGADEIAGGVTPTPSATATATPTATVTPSATASPSASASASPCVAPNLIVDPGFETGGIPNTFWNPETSTNFGTPLCDVPSCGTGGGASPPRTGAFWLWFGGIPAVETATLGQTVTFPSGGTATLRFWMRVGTVTTPFTDVVNVRVDGAIQQVFTEPTVAEGAYTERVVNLNAFANGAAHALLFEYIGPTTGTGSFVIDDVSLTGGACPSPTPSATATASPSATVTPSATVSPSATASIAPTPSPSASASPCGASSTFTNSGAITIPATGTGATTGAPANPYPSNIAVAGVSGTVTKVTVTLTGLAHTFPDDIDVLLVGPGGQTCLLMSDNGGDLDVTGVNLTFDDAAATSLPDGNSLVSGTFKPSNIGGADAFPAPAPAPGANILLSVFNGVAPNGTWNLYVVDDAGIDVGNIATGWSITISTGTGCPTPTPSASASIGPSATPSASPGGTCPANFTVTAALATGDVTQTNRLFRDEPASTCAAPTTCAISAGGPFRRDEYAFTNTAGSASCFVITLTQLGPDNTAGPFIQSAAYTGAFDPLNQCVNFLGDIGNSPLTTTGPKSYSVTVPAGGNFTVVVTDSFTGQATVDYTLNITGPCGGASPTPTPSGTPSTPTPSPTASGTPCGATTFSNSGAITIPATGTGATTGAPANPYPSNIAVAGLSGTVTKVTARLNNLAHTFPDDIDVLLVGPGGQTCLLMSDNGGDLDVTGVTLTFDDAAATSLPDGNSLVSGTFKPSNIGGADAFPAPAPAPGANILLSVFNGVAPNGTWALYVVDDAGIDIGNIANGWDITITTNGAGCPSPTPSPTASASPSTTPCPGGTNVIVDGTFEAGTPWTAWTTQTSTNFGTPMCDVGCGTGGGTAGGFGGSVNWAWFGGTASAETATAGQSVIIASGGSASLTFQLWVGAVNAPFTDVLNVRVDGTIVQTFLEPAVAEPGYTLRTVDVGAFANGASHAILFEYIGPGGAVSNFSVDNVSLIAGGVCPTPTPSATISPSATPTATATIAPSPSATIAPSPSATVAPSATPTASPAPIIKAINLSTRMRVQTGDRVGIGGFIIAGSAPKQVILRAIGPSLTRYDIVDVLADPVLELHGPGSFATITNNNWRDTQEQAIIDTGIPPTNDFESAIVATLAPGAYTAIVRGNGGTSGVALIEVYDLNQGVDSKMANLSTRAHVATGDNIVIAGFLLNNQSISDEVDQGTDDRVIVRGLGPSLTASGIPGALVLPDPTLELRDTNGTLLIANNDWQDNAGQAAEIIAAGLAPSNNLESAIAATLPPGLYTALLAGLNSGTGIGIVEIYERGP